MMKPSIFLLSLLFLLSLFFLAAPLSFVRADGLTFSSWDTMETDKLASIWLIKRFVDKEAKFKFYPKDELITEGIPFDVPQAELRVYHNQSTFESIVNKYKIEDPAVKEIAEIIHDIEINIWGQKLREESLELDERVFEIINNSEGLEECIARSLTIFDRLYERLGRSSANQDPDKTTPVSAAKQNSAKTASASTANQYSGQIAFVSTVNQDSAKTTSVSGKTVSASGKVPSASAASQDPGQIAFVSTISGNWDLWIINPDATGLSQLTDTAIDERYPAISPDSKRIVYSTNDGRIRMINIDGTACQVIESETGINTHLAWSPDGQRIAFTSFSKTVIDDSDIWIMKADGTDIKKLTTQPDIQINPSWSIDGKHILYSSTVYGPNFEILHDLCLIQSDGKGAKILLANNAANIQADYSPDGKKIAFASNITGNMEIWVMDADGKNLKQLTHNQAYDADPCWSPDGKFLAFVSNHSGSLQIWLMDANGENSRQLTSKGECKDPHWR